MNELAAMTIMRYIEEYLFEPEWSWPQAEFYRRTYSRWAAYEILELVLDHPFIPADVVIDEFMLKMLYLSHTAENVNNSIMFSIAADAADEIRLIV